MIEHDWLLFVMITGHVLDKIKQLLGWSPIFSG